MGTTQQDGFDFSFDPGACKKCSGRCCRGASGHVWVGQQEIRQICSFLKTNPVEFIHEYLYRTDNRYAIIEHRISDGFSCIFFDEEKNGCLIYEVRPAQCRHFPFWNYFKAHLDELIEECPGVSLPKVP